jgi:4,5-dihydroxyphthalate decarboxylase
MSDIQLTLAINPYDRALPLISHEVKPDGIELTYQGMPGGNGGVFYDQLKFARYDVSEMSISSYLIARAAGWPYLMLPVFHNRNFSYTDLVIRDASGIRVDHPEDLAGKRFSIRDYQQSAGLWIRGVLTDEFGVRPEDMEWSQTRARDYSLTGASQSTPPVPIRFTDADAGVLMDRGEIDVTWSGKVVPMAERGVLSGGDVDVRGRSGVSTLFSNPKAEALRYFRKTGHFPIHHTTVVREAVLTDHPWVATSLLEAFERSKFLAAGRMTNQSLFVFGDHLRKDVHEVFGGDPYPYGIRQNSATIDYIQTMSVEQGLTQAKQDRSEIFAAETLLL